jgi:hypothetical protein
MLRCLQLITHRLKGKSKEITHTPGNIYVVDGGTYGGDYLVLIKTDYVNFYFLNLGNMSPQNIEFETFQRGYKNKIVKFIEKLPKYVFYTCKQQYEQINNSTHESSETNKNYKPNKRSAGRAKNNYSRQW